jgi:hypothetical protein
VYYFASQFYFRYRGAWKYVWCNLGYKRSSDCRGGSTASSRRCKPDILRSRMTYHFAFLSSSLLGDSDEKFWVTIDAIEHPHYSSVIQDKFGHLSFLGYPIVRLRTGLPEIIAHQCAPRLQRRQSPVHPTGYHSDPAGRRAEILAGGNGMAWQYHGWVSYRKLPKTAAHTVMGVRLVFTKTHSFFQKWGYSGQSYV